MRTISAKNIIRNRANIELEQLGSFWNESYDPTIVDLGANVGHYTLAFISKFPKSKIYCYEPHPYNIKHFKKFVKSDNVVLYEYGLYNETKKISIGLPENGKNNNGCYSIKHNHDSIEVQLKNANDESVRPHIVKIDVEGAEPEILECSDFFKDTKIILIEMLYKDDMEINQIISERLQSLGFTYKLNTTKNNQLWLR